MSPFRKIASNLFPHNNPRCVAPPGIIEHCKGTPIIVASLMRSGTHLLIDLILNNFPEYQRNPLYVDLDQMIKSNDFIWLESIGNYVVKTHYPQVGCSELNIEGLRRLAARSFIIQPVRSAKAMSRSLVGFQQTKSIEDLEVDEAAMKQFWGEFKVLTIPFEKLANPLMAEETVKLISEFIGKPPREPVRSLLPKAKKGLVLYSKFMTRILGRNAPLINTGIRLGE